MFDLREEEYKALNQEWRYDGRESVNEFVVKRFGDQYIHGLHECVYNEFSKAVYEVEDFPDLVSNYVSAGQKFGKQDDRRIGMTEFYYPEHLVSPDKALAFTIQFAIFHQKHIEESIFRMEVYLPELNTWYFFEQSIDLRYLIEFYTEGVFRKKLVPLLTSRPEDFERSRIAMVRVSSYIDVLATILYAQLGSFDLKEAIELMLTQDPDFWKPNVVGSMLEKKE